MPRTPRATVGGLCYHVINRGNAKRQVFLKDEDYAAFLKAMRHACIEVPMRVVAFCLMLNHFHLVLWPKADGELSQWMHWVRNTHMRRYHQHYRSSGRIWQGRFKSFPIAEDEHLLIVVRYVESNAVRAKLFRRTENWKWARPRYRKETTGSPEFLVPGPVHLSPNWLDWVNQAVANAELEALRRSVEPRDAIGGEAWVRKTAAQLGLQSTLHPRGRPRKNDNETGDP